MPKAAKAKSSRREPCAEPSPVASDIPLNFLRGRTRSTNDNEHATETDMADKITLTSKADGFGISAHSARASSGKAIGGVVVIQEIFGVTPHIEAMSAYFADAGYDV